MSVWTILATAFAVGFSGAIMPGPMFTLVIKEVPRWGLLAGAVITLGHAFLEMLIVGALILGLGSWISRDPVIGSIGLLGGLTLLWMGLGLIRTSWTGVNGIDLTIAENKALGCEALMQRKSIFNAAGAGLISSCTNPYWVLWWATIGAGYVTIALRNGTAGIAAFYIGHVSSDFIWFTFVSAAAATGSRFLSPKLYQGIVGVCGVFLAGLAGYFIFSGIRLLSK